MIERWLEEIKRSGNKEQMGMLLVHNGIVRATSKDGRPVGGMELSYDKKELDRLVAAFQEREGIVAISVWITTFPSSIQPLSAAALSIAYSPLTL